MKIKTPILHKNLPVIEVADAILLDQLLADPSTARSLLVRLSERAAIVDPQGFDALIDKLIKAGHLPKVER
jgi:hypothetical protein